MEICVIGVGASGAHAARQAVGTSIDQLRLVDDDERRLARVAGAVKAIATEDLTVVSGPPSPDDQPDVVLLATPAGTQLALAETWLRRGSHVISTSDDPTEVSALLALHDTAEAAGRSVVVGAGFMPGLSCLLVRYAATALDVVEVINVYKAGTAGPSCARRHHRALKSDGYDWLDGEWILRRGGSGRDLAWFPDPFGARDCYRGALASPFLLQPVFPDAHRISARMAANRRDRFTSWLPMLAPPHADGGLGALRVEVRGRKANAFETIILGVLDHPSVVTGTITAVAAGEILAGRVEPGAAGLASWPDPARILGLLWPRGVRVARFEGTFEAAA